MTYSTPPCGFKPGENGYLDNKDGSKSKYYYNHIEVCPECQEIINRTFWGDIKAFIKRKLK